jgi:hypothetical protein
MIVERMKINADNVKKLLMAVAPKIRDIKCGCKEGCSEIL